jgi:hypothetical protein
MGEEKELYSPEVYKRLDLVRKQFQNNLAEQRKQESAERKERWLRYLAQNKVKIGRLVTYGVLAAIVLAVIAVVVASR